MEMIRYRKVHFYVQNGAASKEAAKAIITRVPPFTLNLY
jgi:hypothetical protein